MSPSYPPPVLFVFSPVCETPSVSLPSPTSPPLPLSFAQPLNFDIAGHHGSKNKQHWMDIRGSIEYTVQYVHVHVHVHCLYNVQWPEYYFLLYILTCTCMWCFEWRSIVGVASTIHQFTGKLSELRLSFLLYNYVTCRRIFWQSMNNLNFGPVFWKNTKVIVHGFSKNGVPR